MRLVLMLASVVSYNAMGLTAPSLVGRQEELARWKHSFR
jgi:hypothetical protein